MCIFIFLGFRVRGGGAGGQNPLMDVRDRVFHALFYRVTLTYARAFPKPVRRILEFVIFLKVYGQNKYIFFSFLYPCC